MQVNVARYLCVTHACKSRVAQKDTSLLTEMNTSRGLSANGKSEDKERFVGSVQMLSKFISSRGQEPEAVEILCKSSVTERGNNDRRLCSTGI